MKCIATIRVIIAEMVSNANSGHPGGAMGCSMIGHALFRHVMRFSVSDPKWINRDRFVLSNGHTCAMLYTLLYLSGYDDCTLEDLKRFRQLNARTTGHPEASLLHGVEVSTGPLGQGLANAVGLAIAQAHLAAQFNLPDKEPILDNFTYVLVGDGCIQEGISYEACSLAGHLGLGRLIVIMDDNRITIDGDTDLCFSENIDLRFRSQGWQVLRVDELPRNFSPKINGTNAMVTHSSDNMTGFLKCVDQAKRCTDRPTLIMVRTVIGIGSFHEGTSKVHGAPLSKEDLLQLKQKYSSDIDKSFHIPSDVHRFYSERRNSPEYLSWIKVRESYPECVIQELERRMNREFTRECLESRNHIVPLDNSTRVNGRPPLHSRVNGEEWRTNHHEGVTVNGDLNRLSLLEILLDTFKVSCSIDRKPQPTRMSSGLILRHAMDILPEIIGGSADLTGSTCSNLGDYKKMSKHEMANRYLHFGVREHAMCAIANGMYAFGGLRPFVSTFMNFVGYCWGALRMSALSGFPILFIGTHDSIDLGEDGPTHQPVEIFSLIRATPNINLFRPCDENETIAAYACALESETTPYVLSLSRGPLPIIQGTCALKATRGAYHLRTITRLAHSSPCLIPNGIVHHKNGFKKLPEDVSHDSGTFSTIKKFHVLLLASGSEVHIADEAAEMAIQSISSIEKVSIVSFPCWELFEKQTVDYKNSVLLRRKSLLIPKSTSYSSSISEEIPIVECTDSCLTPDISILRLYIEASSSLGMDRYAEYNIALDSFGASAPAKDLKEYFGFTSKKIIEKLKYLIEGNCRARI